MARAELGKKRRCQSCNKKFFDFSRNPIHCPSCGAEFVLASAVSAAMASKEPEDHSDDGPILPADVGNQLVDDGGEEDIGDEKLPKIDDDDDVLDESLKEDSDNLFIEDDEDGDDTAQIAVNLDDDN